MPPVEVKLDSQKRLLVWRASGKISPEEVNKLRQEHDLQQKISEGWNALLDTRLQDSVQSTEYMKRFVENLPRLSEPARWAILPGTTVGQGMANMLKVLAEEKNIWVRIFETLDEAEAWLADTCEACDPGDTE